ncbi:hypothetical protein IWQ60_005237 [Tieghemiomyces parasiticus]|uniref:Uncharacterized protein n=1 Tax=Tieghemiomyces parasiticus TaxID=78921 RepID=A0A9W8AEF6_9FUNG|nr:hypothetical protein IWQ60_005237 [Tieghemiomyces parasiticus]
MKSAALVHISTLAVISLLAFGQAHDQNAAIIASESIIMPSELSSASDVVEPSEVAPMSPVTGDATEIEVPEPTATGTDDDDDEPIMIAIEGNEGEAPGRAVVWTRVLQRCIPSHYWNNRCHDCSRDYYWDGRCHRCTHSYYRRHGHC